MNQSNLKSLLHALLATMLALTAAACGERGVSETTEPAAADAARITGTVSYRERMALSNLAELEITLEDVSRQDVPATRLPA